MVYERSAICEWIASKAADLDAVAIGALRAIDSAGSRRRRALPAGVVAAGIPSPLGAGGLGSGEAVVAPVSRETDMKQAAAWAGGGARRRRGGCHGDSAVNGGECHADYGCRRVSSG